MLLSHVFIGVADFDRAFAFYEPLMARLGHRLRFVERAGESPPLVQHWCGWQAADADRPLLLVGTAFDGEPATPGHGQMVALLAPDRGTVDAVHALALSLGGRCDGPPPPSRAGARARDEPSAAPPPGAADPRAEPGSRRRRR